MKPASCSIVGSRKTGAVSRMKSFQNWPGSSGSAGGGASRIRRSSKPFSSRLPAKDSSTMNTTLCPRRRSTSPMPTQLFVGPNAPSGKNAKVLISSQDLNLASLTRELADKPRSDDELRYRARSLWLDGLPESLEPRPGLAGNLSCDVVIVGAGFTGLWTAYYLKALQPDLRVAVLEAEIAGFGPSGRNGGWVSSAIAGSVAAYERHS